VIIKDGYDTLKAQLLKREKRKFEIGFVCERNMKHEIQVIFNGIQIRDSPFQLLPKMSSSKSAEMISQGTRSSPLHDFTIIEGGPLEGVQCGEKMWIILDPQTLPYTDAQFLINGNYLCLLLKILHYLDILGIILSFWILVFGFCCSNFEAF
jgi:hypothetical protein